MKNVKQGMLQENISDESIKDVYKNAFKEKGISLKKFNIEHDKVKKISYFHFILPSNIHFWIKWTESPHLVEFINIVNDITSKPEIIKNPNAILLIDTVLESYEKIMKRQSFLKQLLSLILDDNHNKNPMK